MAERGWGQTACHPRARAPTQPHPAQAAIDPCCSGLITGGTAGAGRGARRLPREVGGLPAPWPGLNIYYVLFGLWGRAGGLSHRSRAAGGRGPEAGAGLTLGAPHPSLPGRADPEQDPREPPFPVDPSRGGDLLQRRRGRGDRSGLPRGSDGPLWKRFPPRGRLGRRPGSGPALGDSLLAPPAFPARRPQPGSETAAGAPVWLIPPAALSRLHSPVHRCEIRSRRRRGAKLDTRALPHQARPASGRALHFPPKAAPCRRALARLPAPA